MPASPALKTNSRRTQKLTPWDRLPYDVLPVSTIAEQCYCEHRIHLWLRSPGNMVSVPRELEATEGPPQRLLNAASAGTEFHAKAAESSQPATPRQLRKLVSDGQMLQLLEWPLNAQYGKLPVQGIPDAVCFESGQVQCILEYKVTDSNQLQMSHRVQLQIYGWLLQKNRFILQDALCVCVLVPVAQALLIDEVSESVRETLANRIHRIARECVDDSPEKINWYMKQVSLDGDFWVRLRIFRTSVAAARRELRFFAPYWEGKREPIPSSNPRKCSVCDYNATRKCEVSAA